MDSYLIGFIWFNTIDFDDSWDTILMTETKYYIMLGFINVPYRTQYNITLCL